MLFNSVAFFAFFATTLSLYWGVRRRMWQNRLLLVASYVFYGAWDWRFLGLIAASTAVDFTVARCMAATEDRRRRRAFLTVSLAANLGSLAFFKYAGFFVESAVALSTKLGIPLSEPSLSIVLPVGISFFTFQTLSYTIDVYRGELEPVDDPLDFALFVAFFPQLVAGPIERASALLPQIARPRTIDWGQVNAGLHLIVWGLFKKVVLADNAAVYSDRVFNNLGEHQGIDLWVGALAFTLQIYGDFSGYSDIARGLAKLMGFDLMVNFRLPYFARSPSDFWRRWHVSLSSWLRDYLYISLGGNRGGPWRTYRNLSLTMLLGGLWHGASWNFVLWGAFHGLILVIYRVTPWLNADPTRGALGAVSLAVRVAGMFFLTVLGWVLFRCTEWSDIVWWFQHAWNDTFEHPTRAAVVCLVALPLVVVQLWQQRAGELLVMARTRWPLWVALHAAMCVAILLFGRRETTEFIYFQF